MQRLTIVLLCTGPGSDPSIYRPSRDDVRYRHRHDALVRCVAAALYGGASCGSHNRGDGSPAVELILLYDGDFACMRMKISPPNIRGGGQTSLPLPPLEKEVVAAWRTAAKEAVRSKQNAPEHHVASSSLGTVGKLAPISARKNVGADDAPRLNATCVLDTWETVDSSKSSQSMTSSGTGSIANRSAEIQGMKKLPAHMPSSKRETVSILQSTCPVDYLREHRLNVPIDVALRKFNRGKLQAIWEGYEGKRNNHEAGRAGGGGKGRGDATGDNGAGDDQWDKMERTFRSLLAEANRYGSTKDDSTDVIASYLHESCDAELPCWGWDGIKEGSASDGVSRNQHVFLFLGAVRDMTASENDALARACEKVHIPLVPCRLGPVPEFTSKIVSVAAYHFGRGVLGKGLVELWKRRKSKQDTAAADGIIAQSPLPLQKAKRTLHTIAIVPMDSHSLSYDPTQRNRVMWCMVRLCVCSLWRSKLASGSGSSGEILNNKLTFVFHDGVHMTLKQEDFIAALAEKHMAAPSERQILEELCHRCDDGASTAINGNTDIKRVCQEIVSSSGPLFSDDDHEAVALDFTPLREAETATSPPLNPMGISCFHEKELHGSVMDLAYSQSHDQIELMQASSASRMTLFAIVCIRVDLMEINDKISSEKVGKIHRSLRRAMAKAGITVRDQMSLLDNSCQDVEACIVIMLQHLDYQGRLFQRLPNDDDAVKFHDTNGDRKRKKKKRKDKGKKRRKHKSE